MILNKQYLDFCRWYQNEEERWRHCQQRDQINHWVTFQAGMKYKTSLEDIKCIIADFSDRVFGKDRPYTAPLHHLKKEVDETIEDGDIFEYADCLLLLLDSYRKKFPDKSTDELLEACKQKMEINEKREWGEPDDNGVYLHKK